MSIEISNKIYIRNPDEKLLKVLKKSLSLPNPAYDTLVRRARYTGDKRFLWACKKEFKYYEYKGGVFTCGRGNEERIINYLKKYEILEKNK